MHNDKLTMKREIYISVLETIDGKEFDLQNTLKELRTKFPLVRLETLRSILTQQYSKEVKKTFRSQTSELKRKEYCDSFQKYLNGNLAIKAQFDNESAIAASAINNRFSPALIAKIILSEQLNLNSPDNDAKKRVKELKSAIEREKKQQEKERKEREKLAGQANPKKKKFFSK